MKKNKLKQITEIVLPIICVVGLIVYAALTKDNEILFKLLISIIIIAAFAGIVFGILYILILKNKIIEYKVKKYFNYLKQKNERNIFEEFYILTYQQKADELVKQHLEKNKISGIHSINLESTYNKKVFMYCSYKGFRIVLLFDNDSVQYAVDSPSRYNGTKANINFEKLSKEDISYEQFFDIDELGDFIANLISKLKDKIESFSDTNIVDPIFNGRLLDKTKAYLSHLKKEGLVCVILTPPFTAFMLWGVIYSFVDKNYKIENPAGFYTAIICCSAFSILFFILLIHGIKVLVQRRKFKKDYDLKSFFTICEFPNKVKIIKEKPGKYSDNFYLISAILYFNNIKLIIPFDGELILNKQNIRKCCEECKKIKSEIKYLPKSRIIIDGEKQFVKIIKKQIL